MTGIHFRTDEPKYEAGDVVACGACSAKAGEEWWQERPGNVLWLPEVLLQVLQREGRDLGLSVLPGIDLYTRTRLPALMVVTLAQELDQISQHSNDEDVRQAALLLHARASECVADPRLEFNIEGP